MMERYQPKQHKNPTKAIREHCIECMGGRDSESYLIRISECVSRECALFAFRLGNNPYHTQNLTVEQRQERGERAKLVAPYKKRSEKVV